MDREIAEAFVPHGIDTDNKMRTKQIEVLMAPESIEARNFLRTSSAYAWLLGKLKAAPNLSEVSEQPMQTTKTTIKSHIEKASTNLRGHLTYTMTVGLSWNPLEFLKQQKYADDGRKSLKHVITISGTETHAQAMICEQYVDQVWPFLGKKVLTSLENALGSPLSTTNQCKYPFL
jgi:LPS O-antigen subunit length determinant protein (WzzB/FepE family)